MTDGTMPARPDDECTRIYKEANGEATGKANPLTSERIFRAMRAAAATQTAALRQELEAERTYSKQLAADAAELRLTITDLKEERDAAIAKAAAAEAIAAEIELIAHLGEHEEDFEDFEAIGQKARRIVIGDTSILDRLLSDARAEERERCAKFFELNSTAVFWGSSVAGLIRAGLATPPPVAQSGEAQEGGA